MTLHFITYHKVYLFKTNWINGNSVSIDIQSVSSIIEDKYERDNKINEICFML